MSHQYIKTDPALQEDQDDLLMSYLNSDYMAPSTASPSPATPKFSSIQEANYSASMAPLGFESNVDEYWQSTPSTPNDDLFRQQQAIASCFHPNILNGNLQYVIPSHDQMQQQSISAYIGNTLPTNMMYAPQYYPSQHNQLLLQQQPASPRSLSSYSSSSSDSEQPKKKRGRKKRDSCHSVASSNSCGSLTPPPTQNSNTPTVIVPAPVKHLPTILPAASNNNNASHQGSLTKQESIITKKETLMETEVSQILKQRGTATTAVATKSPAPAVNPNADLQKAATIAKRQERLIKNRAAALLSRKRKREHLSALEEQCTDLTSENQSLLDKVSQLEKENMELKKKLDGKQHQNVTVEKLGSDLLSMMILCYVVFIMSFSSYSAEGLGGLFTNTKLAYDLIESSSSPTLMAAAAATTTTTTGFQLRPYHKECTSDKHKQTFAVASSKRKVNRENRGRFQRVPL
ncbi:positive regulation of ATF6-mediated unfolded protein response [Mucor circinelloides]